MILQTQTEMKIRQQTDMRPRSFGAIGQKSRKKKYCVTDN